MEKDTDLKNILNPENLFEKEFEVSKDFTKQVMNNIEYKMFRKNQMKKTVLLIAILVFFLLNIMTLYYFNNFYNIEESVNIRFSFSIWSCKFVPITIVSLSILLLLDLIVKSKATLKTYS